MSHPYEDILYLPYNGIQNRKRMSMLNRGAQFSPFAALTGYDAAIQETGRITQQYIDLDVDAVAEVDEKLKALMERIGDEPRVEVTYFLPDETKTGGRYIRISGRVRKIDANMQAIVLTDGQVLYFQRIYDISGELL